MRANGSRYRRLDGCGLAYETDKTQSHEKSHFNGVNPAVRVHALLGIFLEHKTRLSKSHLPSRNFVK